MIAENVTYFDSFGVGHITTPPPPPPKKKKKFQRKQKYNNKYLYNTIIRFDMCGYFCIGFIDFLLKGKSLFDYTNLFSPNDYENNNKIILKYFQ